MEKIKALIQNQLDECRRIKNTANDALKASVEHYLTAHASTAYRAEIIEEMANAVNKLVNGKTE